jgi:hypothetical protein
MTIFYSVAGIDDVRQLQFLCNAAVGGMLSTATCV